MEINVKEIFAKYNIPTDKKEFKVNYTNLINCINEINKEVLKEAADSALMYKLCESTQGIGRHKKEDDSYTTIEHSYWSDDLEETTLTVNKESITSAINKVKF